MQTNLEIAAKYVFHFFLVKTKLCLLYFVRKYFVLDPLTFNLPKKVIKLMRMLHIFADCKIRIFRVSNVEFHMEYLIENFQENFQSNV